MKRSILLAIGLVFAGAVSAHAQVFTPAFQSPFPSNGLGVAVSGGIGPEDGYAVEGIARRSYGEFELGARAGVADLDGAALLLGLEYRNPLGPVWDLPVEFAVTAGAQAILGSGGGPGVSAGITGGHEFVLPGATISPYFHPRLALLDRSPGDIHLEPQAELGADFLLESSLRFHVALGVGTETANLGFGLSWR
jgi:hypothetical protein